VMYILLCGCPPFDGADNHEIFQQVIRAKVKMEGKDWVGISKEAKDLVNKLLDPDVKKRLTAAQALEHEWFQLELLSKGAEIPQVDEKVIKMLRNFRTTAKFRKEALKVMVNFLNDAEIKNLKDAFRYIDKDKTGMITVQELQQVMRECGYTDTDQEISKLMKTIHVEDDKPVINYSEFIAATLDSKTHLTKEKLWTVFKYFDTDNSNFITAANLKEAMARGGRKVPQAELDEMIREADYFHDNKVSLEEFLILMKCEDEDLANSPGMDDEIRTKNDHEKKLTITTDLEKSSTIRTDSSKKSTIKTDGSEFKSPRLQETLKIYPHHV